MDGLEEIAMASSLRNTCAILDAEVFIRRIEDGWKGL
jgi:hypothetical protein